MKTKIDLTCPKCKAILSVDSNRDVLFCEYCGAKILLNDENTYTIRNVDEAKIKQVESEQLIRLKELELAQKKADKEILLMKQKTHVSLILTIMGVIIMVIGSISLSLFELQPVGLFSLIAGLIVYFKKPHSS